MACFVSPNAGSGGGIGGYWQLVDAFLFTYASQNKTHTFNVKKGDIITTNLSASSGALASYSVTGDCDYVVDNIADNLAQMGGYSTSEMASAPNLYSPFEDILGIGNAYWANNYKVQPILNVYCLSNGTITITYEQSDNTYAGSFMVFRPTKNIIKYSASLYYNYTSGSERVFQVPAGKIYYCIVHKECYIYKGVNINTLNTRYDALFKAYADSYNNMKKVLVADEGARVYIPTYSQANTCFAYIIEINKPTS